MAFFGANIKVVALLSLALLPVISLGQTLSTQTCSTDGSAVVQQGATAWIIGIISLNEEGSSGYGCGSPGDGSMHSYEAMRLVLELLNKKNGTLGTTRLTDSYVPGIKLGMKVKNYCSNEKSAVAAVSEYFPQLSGDGESCTRDVDNLTLGIIGGSTSDVAMALSEEAAPFHIPVISYEATAPQLTVPGKYTNFMRTISPDGPLIEVIVQLMKKMNWEFVAIVYDSGTYGRSAYSELHARLKDADICLTAGIMIDDSDETTASDTLSQVLNTGTTGVVFFGSPAYARALVERGDNRLPDSGRLQWLFADLNLEMTFPASSVYQHGIIAVTAASRFIVEFEDHWMRINERRVNSLQALENPWFRPWFEERNACSFNPLTTGLRDCATIYGTMTADEIEDMKRRAFQQDQYAEAAVMAVYTYAYALREAQMDKCPGVSGFCPALVAMERQEFFNDYLKKVNLRFKTTERIPTLGTYDVAPYYSPKRLRFNANGDLAEASYFIWNYNDIESGNRQSDFKFRRAGSYVDGTLILNNVAMYSEDRKTRLSSLPPSPCPSAGCGTCLGLPADLKYYYTPGDVVISGTFSLHKMGSTPISCGGRISVNQYQYMEAMIYAVNQINNDPSILPNLKLGGLGFDDCSSSALSQSFLAQVQRGNIVIKSSGGEELDPRTVEAYTAAYSSPLTLPLAEAMNMLMRPMVGYRAGSSELDDDRRYPYYIRALPGIYEEIKAMILLLKQWNWMYVQLVTSDMHYSQNAEKVFRELSAKEGICVVASHNIGTDVDGAERMLMGLQANKAVSPTISLLDSHDNQRFLAILANNTAIRRDLAILATTSWGTSEMIVDGFEDVANRVISLSLRHSTLGNFRNYLSGLQVQTYTSNPWFSEWYMAVHSCTLGVPSDGVPICDMSQPITAGGSKFRLMYEVESVINAVKAIADGLDKTLRSYCGTGYKNVCNDFINAADKGKVFLDTIKAVSFPIENMLAPNTFQFSGKSAVVPFEVYSYKAGRYVKVRDVDPWAQSIVGSAVIQLYNGDAPLQASSSCPAPCLECLYMFNYMKYWYVPGDVVIGAIFDVHYAGSGPFMCGAVRKWNGALYTEVFNFALSRINSGAASVKLDNFKLGGLAVDGCSNPIRSTAIVNRVLTGMDIRSAASGEMFDSNSLVSWMTYDSQTTIDTARLLQALNMPVVSPGATALALNDKKEFYTFFRTIPSDSLVVKGMADFINAMGWKYVLVLNSPDETNREAKDLFKKHLEGFGICVVASYEFQTDGSNEVIIRGIDEADTQIVAVFSEPDRYIESFITEKSNTLTSTPLTYIANRRWGRFTEQFINTATDVSLVNSVFFDLDSPTIAEFTNYLNGRDALTTDNNPWFQEIYEEVMGCNLPGSFIPGRGNCDTTNPITSGRNWEQDIWTLSTMNAVYAIAKATNNVKVSVCGPGVALCPGFFTQDDVHSKIMDELDRENFTDIAGMAFKFFEREADRGYKMYRYRPNIAPQEEGVLTRTTALSLSNSLALKELYASLRSQCPGDCLTCKTSATDLQDFTLISGDIYIVGLFDIHNEGYSPYTCGEINGKHGLQLLEAFNFAIEYVNNHTGMFSDILQGVRIGGVGLDMCKSPTRAANLVANIHSGDVTLSKDGETVYPRRIDAYVATMDTESSIRVADVLTQLAVPQISYGATGMDLLNRNKYKYFLRSVPADDKLARAIVSYLKKFSYTNIQVVYSFDEIGEPGLEEFEKVAFVNKICVGRKHLVGESGMVSEQEARAVVNRISNTRNPEDEVVVLWMKNPLPILEAVNNNDEVARHFLFVVTDKWGADPDFLKMSSLQTLLRFKNLVTFDVETADIPAFDMYLEHKTPDNYRSNPWFQEYFEHLQGCSWGAAAGGAVKPCDPSSTIPRADEYVQDPYVLYVINAVFSVALGLDDALKAKCKVPGVCDQYRNSGERRQRLMTGIEKVMYTDDTHQPFFYTEDGQSDRGYHIYNVTSASATTGTEFSYMNVGSYNDSHFLKLDITYDSQFSAYCDSNLETPDPSDDCSCPFKPVVPSRYMKKDEGGRGLTLVYVGDIHQRDPNHALGCGPINTGVDLQRLLAFFFAIDRINNNADFTLLDSIKLNGLALDSCTHGLRLGQDVYNVLSGNQLCDTDEGGQLVAPSSIIGFVVDKDKNTLPISSMLAQQKITTISPTATLSVLNNRYQYPYFLRVRNDNDKLAEVILSIGRRVGWDYMSAIYTDNIQHRSAAASLLAASKDRGVCMADAAGLAEDATLEDAKQVLEKVAKQVGARGVVLFVDPPHLTLLLQASREAGLSGAFTWVVPSDWAHSGENIAGLEDEVSGSITIETRTAILEEFTDYVRSLTYNNRQGIPDDWFMNIYQAIHQCSLIDVEIPHIRRYPGVCTKGEVITRDMIAQDPSVLHVIISVFSAALGLNNIPQCLRSSLDIAACLQLQERRNELIYDGISGVNFQVLPDLLGQDSFQFSFDSNGNGQMGYIIKNYRAVLDSEKSRYNGSSYAAFPIGGYSSNGLSLDLSLYGGGRSLESGAVPASICALGSTCTCQLPGGQQWDYSPAPILDPSNVQVGGTYRDPETGEAVTVTGIPQTSDRFNKAWGIILAILAAIGAVISFGLFVFLLIMYPIRGGTSILGFILAFGIVLLYLMVFPFIAHADERICGLRRFSLGVVYALVYSALLVKLVDCWRVRGKGESYNVKYSKLGRPAGLFMVTIFLVLVQVMINAEWLILRPPDVVRVFYEEQFWPRCSTHDFYDESLVLSLVYVMVLIVLSLVLSLLTFTSTTNHRESRWILGITVISIPCWVIWCSVATLGAYSVRDPAVAVGLLVNATVMLLLVPVRKLYLLHKYNALIEEEEERESQYAASHKDNDYNSVYGRQYDNHPRLHDTSSNHGSSRAY